MLSQNAIEYTLRHLLSVALPTDTPLAFTFQHVGNQLHITLAHQWHVRIELFTDADAERFHEGSYTPSHHDSHDRKVRIPVFTPSTATGSNPQVEDGTLYVPYDIVTPSFILLSREEEYSELPRDVHNRFLYNYSLARRYEFIDIPLVDEYALLLRKWIMEGLHPDISIRPRRGQIVPTHDVDLLYRFTGHLQAFKSIFGRDLLLHHSIEQTRTSLADYRAWCHDVHQDPYIRAIPTLIEHSQRCGLQSIFFFKALEDGEADATYDVHDLYVSYCINKVKEAGMTVGIHGSYISYNIPTRLKAEKHRLEDVADLPISHGRQHYLRFCQQRQFNRIINERTYGQILSGKSQCTLQTWQHAGIQHDYTLGYAERPGFRCGTCHPYPIYDLDNDCATNIIEHPLIVMDGSLVDYLQLSIDDANLLVDQLKQRCLAVEGDFVILWHNHLLSRNYSTWYEEVYKSAVETR